MWRGFRWLVWLVLAVALVAALGGALLVWTAPGRGVLASWIADFTTSKIPGSMKIGRLESIGFLHPVARDVEFFTPDGERVLHVEKAQVHWNVQQLFEGKIGFHMARADHGEIVIAIDESGTTNLEDAFKKEREEKVDLALESMHFENMTVALRMGGETRFLVRDVRGFVSVWRRGTPGVRVDIGRVRGVFEKPEITGDEIELLQMKGQVWAREHHVASMRFKTRIGNGGIDAFFDYYKREEAPAELKLRPDTGSGARIAAFAIDVRSWFSDKLEVTVEN